MAVQASWTCHWRRKTWLLSRHKEASVFMEISNRAVFAAVLMDGERPKFGGDSALDGVPGSSSGIPLDFQKIAGSTCSALLSTGNTVDVVGGDPVPVTGKGVDVAVLDAARMGIVGQERLDDLDALVELNAQLRRHRLACGPLMILGDVTGETASIMIPVSLHARGERNLTRTFTLRRFTRVRGTGTISVATACLFPGPTSEGLAATPGERIEMISVGRPSGATTVLPRPGRIVRLRQHRFCVRLEDLLTERFCLKKADGTLFRRRTPWSC